MVAEWQAQTAVIDPATMPLTRLANTAIDGVSPVIPAVQEDIARYAASDLVCYRAGSPEGLVAAQNAAWDPVIAWSRATLGARFVLSGGVMFVEQPPESVARVRARVENESSPFRLAALHVMTTLTGSVLVALMHGDGSLGLDEAWAAAHADELFQESRWGTDLDATARRAARFAEFAAASRLWDLSGRD